MRLLIICLLLPLLSIAQDEQWWRNTVQWDGVSGYQKYISYTPRFMGPNALPVPQTRNGIIDSIHQLQVSVSAHHTPGDFTINPSLYGTYVLVPGIISFDAWYIPAEWYQSSHTIKTERRTYYWFYNDHWAQGDFQLYTNVQLLKPEKHRWAAVLRLGYRFPSSSGLGAARFTDAPGYSIDVNTGRYINENHSLRWKLMLGFYNWQMGNLVQQQNDALLAGTGLEWRKKQHKLDLSLTGYWGYLTIKGDDPMVLRLSYETQWKQSKAFLRLQQGFFDNQFVSAEAGMGWLFRNTKR